MFRVFVFVEILLCCALASSALVEILITRRLPTGTRSSSHGHSGERVSFEQSRHSFEHPPGMT